VKHRGGRGEYTKRGRGKNLKAFFWGSKNGRTTNDGVKGGGMIGISLGVGTSETPQRGGEQKSQEGTPF